MARTGKREWTPHRLVKAVSAGTLEEKVDLLKQIGILSPDGKVIDPAQTWGRYPSRTPTLEEFRKG